MRRLKVEHVTRYRYRRPVRFGEHRMMFRPRDSHDLRLVEASLKIRPRARLRWLHDVFSNSIAVADFDAESDELVFENHLTVELYGPAGPDFPIEAAARSYPFSYAAEQLPDLEAALRRHYRDPDGAVAHWARARLPAGGEEATPALLDRLTGDITADFRYCRRTEPGTRPPDETLRRREGSCRDLALFMMEALRSLGLAARFVTGYLYDPALDGGPPGTRGAGAPHAWVEVFLPGAGWLACDPTNGVLGGTNLIRVAVARDPSQAVPLQGTYYGAAADFIEMEVAVGVSALA